MCPRDIGHDRQSKPHAGSLVLIARGIKPRERFDGHAALIGWNSRAIILNPDAQRFF